LAGTIEVHRYERLQRQHRRRAKTTEFQQVYRNKRPLVERSIAWLVHGNRRVPYRGVPKNNTWLHHPRRRLNLRRLLALGHALEHGHWRIG
jgi:DDE family transposase